jgi:hypothetical protein
MPPRDSVFPLGPREASMRVLLPALTAALALAIA